MKTTLFTTIFAFSIGLAAVASARPGRDGRRGQRTSSNASRTTRSFNSQPRYRVKVRAVPNKRSTPRYTQTLTRRERSHSASRFRSNGIRNNWTFKNRYRKRAAPSIPNWTFKNRYRKNPRRYHPRKRHNRFGRPYTRPYKYGWIYNPGTSYSDVAQPSQVTLYNQRYRTVQIEVRVGNSPICSLNNSYGSKVLAPGQSWTVNTHANYVCHRRVSFQGYQETAWSLQAATLPASFSNIL